MVAELSDSLVTLTLICAHVHAMGIMKKKYEVPECSGIFLRQRRERERGTEIGVNEDGVILERQRKVNEKELWKLLWPGPTVKSVSEYY